MCHFRCIVFDNRFHGETKPAKGIREFIARPPVSLAMTGDESLGKTGRRRRCKAGRDQLPHHVSAAFAPYDCDDGRGIKNRSCLCHLQAKLGAESRGTLVGVCNRAEFGGLER